MAAKRIATAVAVLVAIILAGCSNVEVQSGDEKVTATEVKLGAYTWSVSESDTPRGPMDNYFGGKGLSVFSNTDGSVTLKIANKNGINYAAEIELPQSLGYGTYIFQVETPTSSLDKNVVLGLFTYDWLAPPYYNEIDIEFSAWGYKQNPIMGQYVIQPWETTSNITYYPVTKITGPATYSFTWLKDKVEFISWMGTGSTRVPGASKIISKWSYSKTASIPTPKGESTMINLYLVDGKPPFGDGATEVKISGFKFIPAK